MKSYNTSKFNRIDWPLYHKRNRKYYFSRVHRISLHEMIARSVIQHRYLKFMLCRCEERKGCML